MISTTPGTEISQLMCVEVPGDEPVTKIISVLDPIKLNAAPTVTKDSGNLKIQVGFTGVAHMFCRCKVAFTLGQQQLP